jgi:signal transduction histidine kinase
VPGGERLLGAWREGLLGDDHAIAALAVEDGVIARTNLAAVAVFAGARPHVAVRDLFHASCHAKLDALLARKAETSVSELQALQEDAPPLPVRILVLRAPVGEHLLLASPSQTVSHQLMEANQLLFHMTRRLSRDVREAKDAHDAMRQLGNLRELFIAAMAHDLKSPLGAISLSAQGLALAEPPDAGEVRRQTDRIERNVRRMVSLIDSLLLAARLEASTPAIPRAPLRLDAIAHEVADDLAPLAVQAEVTLEVSAEPTPAVGSAVWLGEAIANLVSNAIRHSPAGGAVEIRVDARPGCVRCAVADRGPGIPMSERRSIFERFVQYGERRGTSGLGLYICSKVLEHHGGRVWVEDNPGGGARFVFEIPAT